MKSYVEELSERYGWPLKIERDGYTAFLHSLEPTNDGNPVEGETNEQRIKRCANNLLKAILAGGYDVRKTEGCSGFDVTIFKHTNHMTVDNIIGRWEIDCGVPSVKVEFADMIAPKYESENLTESEA